MEPLHPDDQKELEDLATDLVAKANGRHLWVQDRPKPKSSSPITSVDGRMLMPA